MPQPVASTKSIQEKLQIKPGRSVLILNQPDSYKKLMGQIPADVTVADRKSKDIDVIQVFIESRKELESELPKLKKMVAASGMIWVTYYKGTSTNNTDINRDTISEYAESLGLEGVAMVSIDKDWSALRLKVMS